MWDLEKGSFPLQNYCGGQIKAGGAHPWGAMLWEMGAPELLLKGRECTSAWETHFSKQGGGISGMCYPGEDRGAPSS